MYPPAAPFNPYGTGPIAQARMRMDAQAMQAQQVNLMEQQRQMMAMQQQAMMQQPSMYTPYSDVGYLLSYRF
jgi:hypothetical protein